MLIFGKLFLYLLALLQNLFPKFHIDFPLLISYKKIEHILDVIYVKRDSNK